MPGKSIDTLLAGRVGERRGEADGPRLAVDRCRPDRRYLMPAERFAHDVSPLESAA